MGNDKRPEKSGKVASRPNAVFKYPATLNEHRGEFELIVRSLIMNASTALAFQSTAFDVIDRNNQPWLKSSQIAKALGYADEASITRIYGRHADEFTGNMTGTASMPEVAACH